MVVIISPHLQCPSPLGCLPLIPLHVPRPSPPHVPPTLVCPSSCSSPLCPSCCHWHASSHNHAPPLVMSLPASSFPPACASPPMPLPAHAPPPSTPLSLPPHTHVPPHPPVMNMHLPPIMSLPPGIPRPPPCPSLLISPPRHGPLPFATAIGIRAIWNAPYIALRTSTSDQGRYGPI